MSDIVGTLASLPVVASATAAHHIIDGLRQHGYVVVPVREISGNENASPATIGALADARRHTWADMQAAQYAATGVAL